MKKDVGADLLPGVLARIPESEGRVQKLFRGDEAFRELCADHSECMKMLRGFRKQGPGTEEQIEQYTELLVGLEKELTGRI